MRLVLLTPWNWHRSQLTALQTRSRGVATGRPASLSLPFFLCACLFRDYGIVSNGSRFNGAQPGVGRAGSVHVEPCLRGAVSRMG